MKIQIINGPNINLLGKREPSIYGAQSFNDYLVSLKDLYPYVEFYYYQSNVEGEMINKIHETGFDFDGKTRMIIKNGQWVAIFPIFGAKLPFEISLPKLIAMFSFKALKLFMVQTLLRINTVIPFKDIVYRLYAGDILMPMVF